MKLEKETIKESIENYKAPNTENNTKVALIERTRSIFKSTPIKEEEGDIIPPDDEILPPAQPDEPIIVSTDPVEPEISEEEKKNALYSLVSNTLQRKFDEIEDVRSLITTIGFEGGNDDIIEILNTIINEDSIHLGMYQKALEIINPEASQTMDLGKEKAEEILANKEEVEKNSDKADQDKLEESKKDQSIIRFWAADKDDLDDGELFKTKEEAIEYANSNDRWVRVYKGDFRFLITPKWKPEIVWTKLDQDKGE